MYKFKVGDVVKPLPCSDGYLHSQLIAGKNYTVEGYTSYDGVNVSGEFRNGGNGIGWDEGWFELVEEDDTEACGAKAQIGDKVRLVNKPIWVDAYKEGDTGTIISRDLVTGDSAPEGCVLVALDGQSTPYSIPHGQYEVIKNDADTSFPERKEECHSNKDVSTSSAEAIRDNILRIREKRNDLKMEIIALNKEEADCVEKLKNLGFVLHEGAISSDSAEEKTVLYADDIEEDMTDPKNWEVGDIIESIHPDIAPIGSLATITEIDGDILYRSGGEGFTRGRFDVETKNIWKFHSRPL